MNNYKYKELFNQDSIDKQITITYADGQFTNEDLHSEELELRESLCSGGELRFGACEASTLKFRIVNAAGTLKNHWLTVQDTLAGNTAEPFQFGRYKVYSDVPSGDRNYRDIVAYDAMYDIINADVAAWYNSLKFPLSLKAFRDSFFHYLGIRQENADLVNDWIEVEETIDTASISGKTVITAICEINGVFGHINRNGNFEYVRLAQKAEGLFPANDLYPADNLYPAESKAEKIQKSLYISAEYEDFKTQTITKLQIREKEGDIGVIAGTDGNCYILQDNFLIYGKDSETLALIADKLLGVIGNITYRPFKATLKGNPCLEVGDPVRLYTRRQVIESYILERTLKGIQSLKDSISADGVYEYAEKVNSITQQVTQLRGKTNELIRTVEETKSTISDVEKDLQTQITQNAEAITLEANRAEKEDAKLAASIQLNANAIIQKVAKGDVSSEISQESDKIKIKANRISIESDNFKLSENGDVAMNNGTATNLTINGGNIEIISDEQSSRFKIKRTDGSDAVLLQAPVCFFIGSNGNQVAISLQTGTVSCTSGGLVTGRIGAINSFIGSFNVQDCIGYFYGGLSVTNGISVKGGINVTEGDINISSDPWYNGWSITECLKDLYEKIEALENR